MSINIGDTPQQLEQGLMFDGEVWTKDRIQALQAQVKELSKNQLPEGYITVPAQAWHDLVQKEKECIELQSQAEQLRKYLTEASQIAGFLSYHLNGRMAFNALADLAQKANAWGKAAKDGE